MSFSPSVAYMLKLLWKKVAAKVVIPLNDNRKNTNKYLMKLILQILREKKSHQVTH